MKNDGKPKGWNRIALETVAEIQTGISKSASRQIGDPIRVPYLRVANVQDGSLDLSDVQTILVDKKAVSRHKLKKNDLLLVEGNGNPENLGRCAIWGGELELCLHQNHLFVVRPEKTELDFRYLALQVQSDRGRHYLLSCSKSSSGLATLNSTQLRSFPVLFPCMEEQHSIVALISMWERAIERQLQILDLKVRRKRALMQQLLTGQQRFPEFAKSKGTQDTLLGFIAVDWSMKTISTVFERVRRKNGTSTDLVLTASGQHGLVDQRDYFDRNVAGVSLEGYYLLVRGEFAYNRSAMKGYPYGAIKRLDAHDRGAVSTLYHCFRLKDKESDSDFFMHLFEFGLLNRQLRRICQVGGRAHGLLNVTAGDFEKMLVPLPSKEEQVRIAAVLNKCDEEIEQLKVQLEAFRKQKKGLMERLLTGNVRVPTNTAM